MGKVLNKKKAGHAENRSKICLWCLKKANRCKSENFTKIVPQGKVEEMINKHFKYNVSSDEHLPNALCAACLRNLYHLKSATRDNIELPDLSRFGQLNKFSKTNEPCNCLICKMISETLIEKKIAEGNDSKLQKKALKGQVKGNGVGKGKTLHQKLCTICLSLIARGKRHTCNTSERVLNIKSMVQQTASKSKDKLISSLLKEKTLETGSKSMRLSQRAGKPLNVSINPPKEAPKRPISSDDMLKLQASLNFTQRETLGIASFIRTATTDRKIIEPNLKQTLSDRIHCVDDFFQTNSFNFVKIKAKNVSEITRSVAYCCNLNDFIEYVKRKRQVNEVHLKFGVDGGGNFLKLTLSIQSTKDNDDLENESNPRQKYEDGVASKRFVDSGVKRLFIIGIAQDTQENYDNVLQLWSAIDINTILKKHNGTIATDLKLANILSGIMGHSSLYPCTWCVAEKDKLSESADCRTIGHIKENYLNWMKDGGSLKSAKLYKSCVHEPIFTGNADKLILDVIPPPELHLMIGVVNTVFNHMVKEFSKESWQWAKACNVESNVTKRGSGFNGNACKVLLEKVDLLRRTDQPIGCLKFVQVFHDFHLVVKSCFGKTLDASFKKNISAFKRSYLDLNVPVTPKVHAVFFHVDEFCSKNKTALGFYAEQAVESAHYDFNKIWTKYEIAPDNPDFSRRLLRSVCEYNALHV